MDAAQTTVIDPSMQAMRFAAALGIGVLLGLERERVKTETSFAGVRTFGLVALAGGIAAFLDVSLGRPWLALATFAAIGGLVIVSYAMTAHQGEFGTTTEISALLAFLLGYLCLEGYVVLAAGLAVASGAILALKEWLHDLSHRIAPADVEATLKFAIVSLIILPLVPNQNYGPPPLDVINPYKIWLMVVLISGIDFASYLLMKIVGAEHGIGLTGLLGGLVSSTAVTLGLAQRSRQHPDQSSALALGILIAWTVMFVRIVVLVAAVDPAHAPRMAAMMTAFAVPGLAVCGWLWRRHRSRQTASVKSGNNPFELRQAIRFGAIFAAVTFVAKAAQVYLGDAGLYLAGALAGLTDVDAIALSMAQLARSAPDSAGPALVTIVLAALSNTLFKAGMVATLGAREIRGLILGATGAIVLGAGLGIWLLR
jgi:uncharacterized membrane protein (DUF4010 family)